MRTKILGAVAALCLCLGILPVAAFAAVPEGEDIGYGITYSFDSTTHTLTIKNDPGVEDGEGVMEDFYPFGSPFYNNHDIQTVIIEDGVTHIGDYMFSECIETTSISIPNSVTSIGKYAFDNCDQLDSITIPDGVTSISEGMCNECWSLNPINIPNGVTSIGQNAFYNCVQLTSPTIPESVTSIGSKAFYKCSQLTSLTIPESVTSIGNDALSTNSNISCTVMSKTLDLQNSGLNSGDTLTGYEASLTESYAEANGIEFTVIEGTLVEGTAATCTESGLKDYYTFTSGETTFYFEDAACNQRIPNITTWKTGAGQISALGHNIDTTIWTSNESNHWNVCSRCQSKSNEAAHTYGDWQTTTEATHATPGEQKRMCTVCGYTETQVIPQGTHEFSPVWKSNETSHWHECACGEKASIATHEYGDWQTTTEATHATPGEQKRMCTVCGYTETQVIPQLSSNQTSVDKSSSITKTNSSSSAFATNTQPKTNDGSVLLALGTIFVALISGSIAAFALHKRHDNKL